jgi:hypothetical protein
MNRLKIVTDFQGATVIITENNVEVFHLCFNIDNDISQIEYLENHYRKLGYNIEIHEYCKTNSEMKIRR